jgi:DNA-binding response OmpR family regulator
MPKIFIISDKIWLETLLKQHFDGVEISTGNELLEKTDILINDNVNINIKALDKTWLLQKPINLQNLINIIEQAIELISNSIIQIGPISFFPKERLCKLNDEEIRLTQKETEILLYLYQQNKPVDKLTLLNEIWGYGENITTHTLETHIHKLRHKFADKYEIILSHGHEYQVALN